MSAKTTWKLSIPGLKYVIYGAMIISVLDFSALFPGYALPESFLVEPRCSAGGPDFNAATTSEPYPQFVEVMTV